MPCWGANAEGQLGDTSTTTRTTPVPVAGGFSDWSDVSLGSFHGCARRGGALYCWGRNGNGQLGDNTVTQRLTPTAVVNFP